MRLRELMTESLVTAPPDCSVRTVAELMRERNVGSVVLVDEAGRPVGFITDRDLAVSVVGDARSADDEASAFASTPVVTGSPDMRIEDAVELMATHRVRRLPIADGDRLTGIVTLDDLAVRSGDAALAHDLTLRVTLAARPDFYFHERGD